MQYRTMKLREIDLLVRTNGYDGIQGYYRAKSTAGSTRKEIAYALHMSVPALEKWITKWNKEQDSASRTSK